MEIQLVELHFADSPVLDLPAIKTRAEAILGETLEIPESRSDDAFMLFHTTHAVQFKDGKIPPQTAILRSSEPVDLDRYKEDIEQSWGWRDCSGVLATSRHTLLVTEMMAQALEPALRVRLFHGVLQALTETTQPVAMVFRHSQQVVAPADYLANCDEAPFMRPGSVNVRFFNISGSDGEMLMDTRGLNEVGLHDLQCHFRTLNPGDVARVLFNTAGFLMENGPIIESGNTIPGVNGDEEWSCQFENALIGPDRELLDINPGASFAAGRRG